MTIAHRTRGGADIVCPPCTRHEHEGCLDGRPGDQGLACHCSICRPARCETCYPPPRDGQNRKGSFCQICFMQMPLVGGCQDHPEQEKTA